jgi:hypothetical protein
MRPIALMWLQRLIMKRCTRTIIILVLPWEAISSSETWITTYKTTHNSEDHIPHFYSRENLRSHFIDMIDLKYAL